MIKLTYKRKSKIKTTEEQALPAAQPEAETLVETVLSASQMAGRVLWKLPGRPRALRSWAMLELEAVEANNPVESGAAENTGFQACTGWRDFD